MINKNFVCEQHKMCVNKMIIIFRVKKIQNDHSSSKKQDKANDINLHFQCLKESTLHPLENNCGLHVAPKEQIANLAANSSFRRKEEECISPR